MARFIKQYGFNISKLRWICRCVIILTIFLNFFAFNAQSQTSSQAETVFFEKSAPLTPDLVIRQAYRAKKDTESYRLLEALDIKPESVILDIGGGSGQYAYIFAERLRGGGKVLVTDIDPDMIDYIKEQARVKNLPNLFPVLVDSNGLDTFYLANEFDKIFVANTYFYIQDRISYFKALKKSLVRDGQLVILEMKVIPEFTLSDISDFDGLIKQLSSENTKDPFYSHFSEATKKMLRRPLDNSAKKLLKKSIINELNLIAADIYFLSGFLNPDKLTFKKQLLLSKVERDYLNGSLNRLKNEEDVLTAAGVLDINNLKVNSRHYFNLKVCNTILIVQKYRQYLYHGKPAPYLPGGYDWQNSSVIEELASAGYSLKAKYDFIPFKMILIFTADKSHNQDGKIKTN